MKKNLKSCVEVLEVSDRQCLVDMNQYALIEQAGLLPDLRHKKSAHMTAGWAVGQTAHAAFAMGGADLDGMRYLTFSAFAAGCAGMRFRLLLGSAEGGNGGDGYEAVLSVPRDGWNDYRLCLPYLPARGTPLGWNHIESICFDVVGGVPAAQEHPMLYLDNLFVWEEFAPPLYTTMPELKGAALFSKTGSYAIVDRKRVANALGEAQATPFEQDGVLWLPMAPVAAVLAHSAVADNLAMTLSFTYRRKKYAFSANSREYTVDGEAQKLGFFPKERGGSLFFPAEYVCQFFRWRQLYASPCGLFLLSNRKNAFADGRDDEIIRRLMADMTYVRPTAGRVLDDLHRRFNPSRGRLLASFDDLMKLRRGAKEDEGRKALLNALKQQYGKGSASYAAGATDGAQSTLDSDASLENGAQRLFALAMLYRATGDKDYCVQAYRQVEELASLEEWSGSTAATLGLVSFSMAIAYDWCRHVWDEAQKALAERAMLRRGMRVGLAWYQGKGMSFRLGGSVAAQVDAGMLAMALALADVYPETALHLLSHVLPHVEACFDAYAPDGGFSESISAWEKTTRALVLFVAMLQKACGTDYGFASSAGFLATAYFPVFTETENGAWNYHNSTAGFCDTAVLGWFSAQSGDDLPAWLHSRRLQTNKTAVTPLDLLFYRPTDREQEVSLPLDAVYRRSGLAVMRSDWGADATFLGLHAGSNRAPNADLDVGTFLLEMGGERFFGEIGGDERFSVVMRRRAEGQNTLLVAPPASPAPDQAPDADAVFTEMKDSASRAYAVVDLSSSHADILRGKRGAMLCEERRVAVIQDEVTLTEPRDLLWNAWTTATVEKVGKGRSLKLTKNGKTMICRLCGVSALFEVETFRDTEWSRISVHLVGKQRVRMAVVCYLEDEEHTAARSPYEVLPISTWGN